MDSKINPSVIPAYLKYLIEIGVTGAYIHGTTGEGVSLGHEEKKILTKGWMDARSSMTQSDNFMIIANVSSCVAHETLDHAKYCSELGVDAIAFLPPFYYRPATPDHLVKYIRMIASAAPVMPLIYYHFPEMTKVDFPLKPLLEKLVHDVPSFAGVKYTSKDVVQLANIQREFGSRIKFFAGYEESLLAAFAVGLNSGICAQFNFKDCVLSYTQIRDNVGKDQGKALKAQEQLAAVAKELAIGTFIPNVKKKLRQELPVGDARPPVFE